jgi:mono/diheme cytochrome c family protein
MKKLFAVAAVSILLLAIGVRASADIPKDVAALFQKRCAVCHKGKFPPKGLNFEPVDIAAAIDRPSREVPALKIIDSKDPEASYLLKKIHRLPEIVGKPMPPPKPLTAEELRVIETWIVGLKSTS